MLVLRKILFKLSFSSNSLMSLHMLSVEFQPHLSAVGQPSLVGSSRTPFMSMCQSLSPLQGEEATWSISPYPRRSQEVFRFFRLYLPILNAVGGVTLLSPWVVLRV